MGGVFARKRCVARILIRGDEWKRVGGQMDTRGEPLRIVFFGTARGGRVPTLPPTLGAPTYLFVACGDVSLLAC